MYQVFKTTKGIKIEEVPTPVISEKELLVKVFYSLISTGTETASLKSRQLSSIEKLKSNISKIEKLKKKFDEDGFKAAFNKVKSKVHSSMSDLKIDPFGYSVAGEVIAIGNNVQNIKVGDRVACAGSGFATHSEFVRIPINLAVKIPDNVQYKSACYTTVGSIALHGIRRTEVKPGETIVIIGLGLLGQLALQIGKSWGLRVIGIDLLKERTDLAEMLGCDLTVLADDIDIEKKINDFTNSTGADSVIIFASTKSSSPANQAMKFSKPKGRIVVVGAIGMDLERETMYKKELDFVMSTSYGPGRYDDNYEISGIDYPFSYVRWTENRNMQEFMRLLQNEQINTDLLTSSIYDLIDADKAINSLLNSPIDNIAVLLKYDENKNFKESAICLSNRLVDKNRINVAIIGAGGFAQRTHLPNFKNLSKIFNLYAIVDQNPGIAKQIGGQYNVNIISGDYKEIIKDDNIDLIVITTQHNTHAEIAHLALLNHKSVLVEKPLAINWNQYIPIKKLLDQQIATSLFIGFNRRYSPFIKKIKDLLNGTSEPIFLNYRINAGSINKSHWIQNPTIGGGRLIGEVCHFIDLVNYIMDSDLVGYNLMNIPPNGRSLQTIDNFSINISYANGAIAQISYISLGSKFLPKEKIELHYENKSIVIDDFLQMHIYDEKKTTITLKTPDKGHKNELIEIYKKLRGEESLVPNLELDLLATELTLQMINEINGANY